VPPARQAANVAAIPHFKALLGISCLSLVCSSCRRPDCTAVRSAYFPDRSSPLLRQAQPLDCMSRTGMAQTVRSTDEKSYQTPAGLKWCICALKWRICALQPAGLSAGESLAPLGGEGQRSQRQCRGQTKGGESRPAQSPDPARQPFQSHLMTVKSRPRSPVSLTVLGRLPIMNRPLRG
jgi:hypothetical protein